MSVPYDEDRAALGAAAGRSATSGRSGLTRTGRAQQKRLPRPPGPSKVTSSPDPLDPKDFRQSLDRVPIPMRNLPLMLLMAAQDQLVA